MHEVTSSLDCERACCYSSQARAELTQVDLKRAVVELAGSSERVGAVPAKAPEMRDPLCFT